MNPVQRRKYQNLLQKAEFSSLHEALALVKRVCFHEMLVPDYVLGIPDNGMPSGKPTCASFSTATLNICRQASLNISRTFDYRNTSGSCKLEHLVARFREEKLQKLQSRVIVVVSTDLEANLTHRCLLTSGIGHLASSVSTSPIIYHLSTQEVMRKFNDTSRVGYASAVAIVKDSVFNFPNICPMNVDTVYILSSSWATARNYCRCLRSNESNIYRLIAADTLEELQERKGGSFLHLQHYRITDARPILSAAFQKTFVFDSSKLLSNAPYILEFLKERSQPVVRSGMGKGKGCFLDGLNATSANVETEEVDNSNALIEWISKFYYDLEMAEKSLSGRIEQSFHFGWPLQTLESIRGVGKGSPLLHRYAALTVYRSMVHETESIHRTESPSSLAEAPQALKLPALIVSRVSQHEERLAFLHYSKVGPQSSSADDFSHQLHNLYRAGALVDPCLYISPLCGGSGKCQPMIPPRRRKFEADFELQFIVEPPAPIAKVLPKKARTSSTGGANPRRRNPNPGERSKKSVGAVVTSSNASDSVALSDSIHFDDFGIFLIRCPIISFLSLIYFECRLGF